MEPATRHLLDRPYQDIVDDLLTAVVGGVVNEPITYDLAEDLYLLAEPAKAIRTVVGTKQQTVHAFQPGVDFDFLPAQNAIVWLDDSQARPDADTDFYVDYYRTAERPSPLTDINVGSVTRTLCEAVGRELSVLYRQIDQVYQSGFIDTASGKALDLVVSILGVTRLSKDHAAGLVTFFRDSQVKGNITIPEGTELIAKDGGVTFHTSERRTLQLGQVRIDIPIRATDAFHGPPGRVPPGTITTLSHPIAGIDRIDNRDATGLGANDESDEELRARARTVLLASGKGTIAALAQVVAEQRATLTGVQDPNRPLATGLQGAPAGTLSLYVSAEPEQFPLLREAIEETRAAGIHVNLVGRFIYLKFRLVAKLNSATLKAEQKANVVDSVIRLLQDYLREMNALMKMNTDDPAISGNNLVAYIKDSISDPSKSQDHHKAIRTHIKEMHLIDIQPWCADYGHSAVDTLVDALDETFRLAKQTSTGQITDELLRQAVELAAATPPGNGSRTPIALARFSSTGKVDEEPSNNRPASPEEIELGQFTIDSRDPNLPKGDGALGAWRFALAMEPADVLLQAPGG